MDKEDPPYFSLEGKKCFVSVIEIFNGNTVRLALKVDGKLCSFNCVLSGYTCYDTGGFSTSPMEKSNAYISKSSLGLILKDKKLWAICGPTTPDNKILVRLYTRRFGFFKSKKFCINDWMINNGSVIAFQGITEDKNLQLRKQNEDLKKKVEELETLIKSLAEENNILKTTGSKIEEEDLENDENPENVSFGLTLVEE